jgi:peptidoglycan/LPS O-acetylase OafA/YrhL
MSKLLLGLVVGGVLGLIDGATAWFTPEVRPVLLSIVIASTCKGLITGIVAGWIARRTNSLPMAICGGLLVGLALSYAAAAVSPGPDGTYYYWEIMLPGAVLGAIVGFASQRFGRASQPARP